MRRKKILLLVFIALCVTTLSVLLRPRVVFTALGYTPAASLQPYSIGEHFEGEELYYTIGYWLLKDAAVGKFTLERDPDGDGYIATLKAETTGVVGWFLRYRKDTYTARLEEVEGGGRFRTLTFEKNVDVGGKIKRSITELDHENGTMKWKVWKRGRLRESDELVMEPGEYYDGPLTAFFNFRYGVYGEIEEGREFIIKTFPKSRNKLVNIYLKLATKSEQQGHLADRAPSAGYFAFLKIDKDLFDSKSGEIEMLFSDEVVPLEVIAKDVLFFGDVRGKLVAHAPGERIGEDLSTSR
jgi:hypothetical protein